jgi:hypothetical protein
MLDIMSQKGMNVRRILVLLVLSNQVLHVRLGFCELGSTKHVRHE